MDEIEVLSLTVPAVLGGERLDRAATALVQGRISRTQIKYLIDDGDLLLDGVATRPSERVKADQRIEIFVPPPPPSTIVPRDIPLDIVHEDEHLIVVDKPSGMVVHPAAGHHEDTLVNALMFHRSINCGDPGRPGIVHRLDKDTSGLMMVAKEQRAHERLAGMIASHQVTREYLAIVAGLPAAEGTIQTPYGRSTKDRKKFTSRLVGPVRAITRFRVERSYGQGEVSLIRVVLGTGRTHQIRVHASESGWPVVGDPIYGRPARKGLLAEAAAAAGRTMLHSTHLELSHPVTGRWLEFTREPPGDFRKVMDLLERAG